VRNRPPCGTHAGYVSHKYYKEPACDSCRVANTEYRKEWGRKNKERDLEIKYAWEKRNPDMKRENMRKVSRRRRLRLSMVESEPYTIETIIDLYGPICHICSEEIDMHAPRGTGKGEGWERGFQIDHVIPLVKGGTDLIENVRPAHGRCNTDKHMNLLETGN
jgi:5-methylcytosine-specific restriction endonuclease McrA